MFFTFVVVPFCTKFGPRAYETKPSALVAAASCGVRRAYPVSLPAASAAVHRVSKLILYCYSMALAAFVDIGFRVPHTSAVEVETWKVNNNNINSDQCKSCHSGVLPQLKTT